MHFNLKFTPQFPYLKISFFSPFIFIFYYHYFFLFFFVSRIHRSSSSILLILLFLASSLTLSTLQPHSKFLTSSPPLNHTRCLYFKVSTSPTPFKRQSIARSSFLPFQPQPQLCVSDLALTSRCFKSNTSASP